MGHPKDKSDEELLWETVRDLKHVEKQRDVLRAERDAYKLACERAGVCMSCVVQAPEPYGCHDCLNTGWVLGEQFVWVKEKPATPPAEGWYRVMHAGDSESLDGHTLYDFPDYEDWAYWTPAAPDELEDFEGGYKGTWTTMHDEEGEFIFAYCGPIPTPAPFHKEKKNG